METGRDSLSSLADCGPGLSPYLFCHIISTAESGSFFRPRTVVGDGPVRLWLMAHNGSG